MRKKSKRDRDRLLHDIRQKAALVAGTVPSPEPRPAFNFIIDVLGTCNLRCPSCPVGNSAQAASAGKRMSPDLLNRILDKALQECTINSVGLYNWTEPILHPELPELIRIVQSRGLPCSISANLNHLKKPDEILRAEPYQFHVSVSGFTQDTYGRTHRGGDIERVKQNMIALCEARARTKSRTYLKLIFHRYLDNAEDEIQMRVFAEDLGFRFEPNWAIFMPLEKSMAYIDPASTGVTLTDEDRKVIDLLALDLKETFELSRKNRAMRCSLLDGEIVLDCEGEVQLCCGVYDRAKYGLGNFLDSPLKDLHAKKYKHPMCGTCMKMGGHAYLTHRSAEHDRIAIKNRERVLSGTR